MNACADSLALLFQRSRQSLTACLFEPGAVSFTLIRCTRMQPPNHTGLVGRSGHCVLRSRTRARFACWSYQRTANAE